MTKTTKVSVNTKLIQKTDYTGRLQEYLFNNNYKNYSDEILKNAVKRWIDDNSEELSGSINSSIITIATDALIEHYMADEGSTYTKAGEEMGVNRSYVRNRSIDYVSRLGDNIYQVHKMQVNNFLSDNVSCTIEDIVNDTGLNEVTVVERVMKHISDNDVCLEEIGIVTYCDEECDLYNLYNSEGDWQ